MKHLIIPTIFAHNKKEFDERFAKLIEITHQLQIDFMDGKFVHGKSISIEDVPDCHEYWVKFEAHLMMQKPENYIEKLKEKGFKKIIFHYEAVKNAHKIKELISLIKKNKMKVFIAINPATKIDKIIMFLGNIGGVLVMGINPGKEHQKFIPSIYEKIGELRRVDKKIIIQVDGGVNFDNIRRLRKLGVNYINSGSLISDSAKPKKMLKMMKVAF